MTRDEIVDNLFESLYQAIKAQPRAVRAALIDEVDSFLETCDEARFAEDDEYQFKVWTDSHAVTGATSYSPYR